MGDPPTERSSAFPQTQWSLVQSAAGQQPDSAAAMGKLLERYVEPMKAYLMRRHQLQASDAEDLTQGFLVSQVLERHLLRRAQKNKGRFRTFLLVALRRYAINRARDSHAGCRDESRNDSLSALAVDPAGRGLDPKDKFDQLWARQTIHAATARMQLECRTFNRPDIWGIFEARILKPAYDRVEPLTYVELASHFRLQSTTQAANLLTTGKRMFERNLRTTIEEYESDPKRADSEIADLIRIVGLTNILDGPHT